MDKIIQIYKHDGVMDEGLISFNLNSVPSPGFTIGLSEEVWKKEAEKVFESLLVKLPGLTLEALVRLMVNQGIG